MLFNNIIIDFQLNLELKAFIYNIFVLPICHIEENSKTDTHVMKLLEIKCFIDKNSSFLSGMHEVH